MTRELGIRICGFIALAALLTTCNGSQESAEQGGPALGALEKPPMPNPTLKPISGRMDNIGEILGGEAKIESGQGSDEGASDSQGGKSTISDMIPPEQDLLASPSAMIEVVLEWQTLRWDTGSPNSPAHFGDVDLHLFEPTGGDHVYFANTPAASGGELVSDCNHYCEEGFSNCSETIIYDGADPLAGVYSVSAGLFSSCDSDVWDVHSVVVTIHTHGGEANGGYTYACNGGQPIWLLPEDEGQVVDFGCKFVYVEQGDCLTDAQCIFPPADYCKTGTETLRDYNTTGLCTVGDDGLNHCEYPYRDIECEYTCEVVDGDDDHCKADPCTGVACPTRDNTCDDEQYLFFYTDGTCRVDEDLNPYCQYSFTFEYCEYGCVSQPGDDVCMNLCEGISCTAPPEPMCLGDVLYTYESPGTCKIVDDAPECEYDEVTEVCENGCTDDHCRECEDSSDCPTNYSGSLVCTDQGYCEGLFLFFKEFVTYPDKYVEGGHEIWVADVTSVDTVNPEDGNWTCVAGLCTGNDKLGPLAGNTWEVKGPLDLVSWAGKDIRIALRYYGEPQDGGVGGDIWNVEDFCLADTSPTSGYPDNCKFFENFDGVASPNLPDGWARIEGDQNQSDNKWRTSSGRFVSQPQSAYQSSDAYYYVEWYLVSDIIELCAAGEECCTGIPCENPPDDFCVGDDLVAYEAVGTCTDGECSYADLSPVECDISCISAAGDDYCAECDDDADCVALGTGNYCDLTDQTCQWNNDPKLFFVEQCLSYENYQTHEILVGPRWSTDPVADSAYWEVLAGQSTLECLAGEVDRGPLSLKDWARQTVRLAFRYTGVNADSWLLDDVCVHYTNGTAYPVECNSRVDSTAEFYEGFDDVIPPALPTDWWGVAGPASEVGSDWWKSYQVNEEIWARCSLHSTLTVDNYIVTAPIRICPYGQECCVDYQCDQIPNSECADDTHVREFSPDGGVCTGNVCDYVATSTVHPCAGGCNIVSGECAPGDPCNPSENNCPNLDGCETDWQKWHQVAIACENDGYGYPICEYGDPTYTNCPYGCSDGFCLDDQCYYDEDTDSDNDLLMQQYIDPPVCWRRCRLAKDWDGAVCSGTVTTNYNANQARIACNAVGPYRLPKLDELLDLMDDASDPANNCTDQGTYWECPTCADSLQCVALWGADDQVYWSETEAGSGYHWAVDMKNAAGTYSEIFQKADTETARAMCVLSSACSVDDDCPSDNQWCDTSEGRCRFCITDAHCGETCQYDCTTTSKVCKTDGLECVECNTTDDCTSPDVCYLADNICVECNGDVECQPTDEVCKEDTHVCVECTQDKTQNCDAVGSVCNDSNVCVECNEDTDCDAGPGAGEWCDTDETCKPCDTSLHCGENCVDCTVPENYCPECATDYKMCAAAGDVCVECSAKADCDTGYYCNSEDCTACDVNNYCGSACTDCTTVNCANCATGKQVCLSDGSGCAECNSDSDCNAGAGYVCNPADNTCVECNTYEDCTTGEWCNANACVDCNTSQHCGLSAAPPCNDCTAVNCDNCDTGSQLCKTDYSVCVDCNESSECLDGHWCSSASCIACEDDVHCGPNCDECTGITCTECVTNTERCATNYSGCVECNANDDHCDNGYWCNTGDCQECNVDAHCGDSCELNCTLNACAGCHDGLETCNTAGTACVQCDDDADCNTGGGYVCDTSSHMCVDCIDYNDCDTGEYCLAQVCEDCTTDTNCGLNSAAPCVDCTAMPCANCSEANNNAYICEGNSLSCVQCNDAVTDCDPGFWCDAVNNCTACGDDLHCGTDCDDCTSIDDFPCTDCINDAMVCATDDTQCVQCNQDGHCDSGHYCSSETCVDCTVDEHCGSTCQDCTLIGCGNCQTNTELCDGTECIECEYDTDCDTGYLCESTFCVPAVSCPGSGGEWIPDTPDVCWYIGTEDQSCDEVCADQGSLYDSDTASFAGDTGSGGTNAHCEAVQDLLGVTGSTVTDTSCSGGLGCSSGVSAIYTDTWTATDVPQTIPDANSTGILSNIDVDVHGVILDVNVKIIGITHERDTDIDMYIRNPNYNQVTLSTDNGGNDDNYTNTVFDTGAATSITDGSGPFTGTFSPEGNLAEFNGRDPFGTWTLLVRDDRKGYEGTLTGWEITIQYSTTGGRARCTSPSTDSSSSAAGAQRLCACTADPPACGDMGGALVGDTPYQCWFLGDLGDSCEETCTAYGGTYNANTASYAGSGGSDANCTTVLNALNKTGSLTTPDSVCDSATFSYKKPITIAASQVSGSGGSLTDFPVLVSITDSDLASEAQSSGYDIIFTSSDATTCGGSAPCQLDHEVDSWDSGTGKLEAWVRIPSLSQDNDTVIYMQYGNADVSSATENPTGVWGSSYYGVWHFGESGTGTRYDSSSSNNHATTQSYDNNEATTGKIGGADYIATNDYLSTTNSYTGEATQEFTMDVWFKTTSTAGRKIVGYESNQTGMVSSNYGRHMYVGTDGKLYFCTFDGSLDCAISSGSVADGGWHHAVGMRNDTNNTVSLYLDGSFITSVSSSLAESYSGYWRIGSYRLAAWTNAGDGYFNGTVDEIRIYQGVRDANWIATSYANQNSPGTFYSVGSEETGNWSVELGKQFSGACWYLGAAGESCDATCTDHDGYNTATASYAGSGGSDANCETVMAALGHSGSVTSPAGACNYDSGSTTEQNVPMDVNYNYSYTQSIYTPTNLCSMGAKTITAIQWEYDGGGTYNEPIKIYMDNNTKSSFISNINFVDADSMTLVYSGTISLTSGHYWKSITLDTSFDYDGTSNLIIAVDRNTGNYYNDSDEFRTTNSATNRSVVQYSDYDDINPSSPPGSCPVLSNCGRTSYIPNIILNYAGGGDGDEGCVWSGSQTHRIAGSTDGDGAETGWQRACACDDYGATGTDEGCVWNPIDSEMHRITADTTTNTGAESGWQRACACDMPECLDNNDCDTGYWCDTEECEVCNVAEHCGTSCSNCTEVSCANCLSDHRTCKSNGTGCVDCNAKADCDTGYFCDTNECVECTTNESCGTDCNNCTLVNCPGCDIGTRQCNTDGTACIECNDSDDCGTGYKCRADQQLCVECLEDVDCNAGEWCDTDANECKTCNTDENCTVAGCTDCTAISCSECADEGQVCKADNSGCVECNVHEDCANGNYCLGVDCVQCNQDDHCGTGAPPCEDCTDNPCESGNCDDGYRVCAGDHCEDCVDNDDCDTGYYCGASYTCVECLEDAHCGTGYWCNAGWCDDCDEAAHCGNSCEYNCATTSCPSGNCDDGFETCNTAGTACVECNDNTDCSAEPNYECNSSSVCEETLYCPGTGGAYLPATSDVCWYRADNPGDSCEKVCVDKAQSTCNLDRTLNFAGSSGSNANCETVLDLVDTLGTDTVVDTVSSTNEVGCYILDDTGYPWKRETVDATDCQGENENAYRACACDIPSCDGGAVVGGYCWYKGTTGQSCEDVCSSNGHYGVATATYAGSGGTDDHCKDVAAEFGAYVWTGTTRVNPGGMGCFASSGSLYRDLNLTNAGAVNASYERFCACYGGGGDPECDHGGGVMLNGACWFAGQDNADCDQTCTVHNGTYNAQTLTYAGSSGEDSYCDNVLDALGAPSATMSNDDGTCYKQGCLWSDKNDYRLRCTDGSTTSDANGNDYYRVCACDMPECEVDLNCVEGEYCNLGTCDTCDVETACGSDCEDCSANTCASGNCDDGKQECSSDGTACVDCEADGDCATGYKCESNVCVPSCPGTGGKQLAATPDVCWYLGSAGDSCDEVCTAAGTTASSDRIVSYVGSGGSNTNCDTVLTLLGKSGSPTNGPDCDSGGEEVSGLPGVCWFMGNTNQSCTNVCASHENYNNATQTFAGLASEGGSASNCQSVISKFDSTYSWMGTTGGNYGGTGCFWVYNLGDQGYQDSGGTTANASYSDFKRVCACGDEDEGCGWNVSQGAQWRKDDITTTTDGSDSNFQRACACVKPCENDADCGTGKWCNSGTCDTCDVDAHCGSGCDNCTTTSCVYGNCDDNYQNCLDYSNGCVDCVDDGDCAGGYTCNESNVCEQECPGTGGVYLSATPDVCWYQSANNVSCDTVCSNNSSISADETISYVGSGGSAAQCKTVLDALGSSGSTVTTLTNCGVPLGCYYNSDPFVHARRWCQGPTTTTNQSYTYGQTACACMKDVPGDGTTCADAADVSGLSSWQLSGTKDNNSTAGTSCTNKLYNWFYFQYTPETSDDYDITLNNYGTDNPDARMVIYTNSSPSTCSGSQVGCYSSFSNTVSASDVSLTAGTTYNIWAGSQGGTYSVKNPKITIEESPDCGGTSYGGYCWYMSASGGSCNTACIGHGSYDSTGTSWAGNNATNCQNVASEFGDNGWQGPFDIGAQTGCVLYNGNEVYQDTSGTTGSGNDTTNWTERYCACTE